MKTLILVCLLFFSLENLCAQIKKENFFIETGMKLTGGGEYLNFIGKTGIAYIKNKTTYFPPVNYTSEYLHTAFSWSLAPRVGYQPDKLFSSGIDFQYFSWAVKDYMTCINSIAGALFRKYITTTRVRPFIEFSYGRGRSKKESDEIPSGGVKFKQIKKMNLQCFAGAAGVAIPLDENFRSIFSAKLQNTIEKDSKQPESVINDFRDSNIEVTPMMLISYFIKKKNKK